MSLSSRFLPSLLAIFGLPFSVRVYIILCFLLSPGGTLCPQLPHWNPELTILLWSYGPVVTLVDGRFSYKTAEQLGSALAVSLYLFLFISLGLQSRINPKEYLVRVSICFIFQVCFKIKWGMAHSLWEKPAAKCQGCSAVRWRVSNGKKIRPLANHQKGLVQPYERPILDMEAAFSQSLQMTVGLVNILNTTLWEMLSQNHQTSYFRYPDCMR